MKILDFFRDFSRILIKFFIFEIHNITNIKKEISQFIKFEITGPNLSN